MEKRGVDYSNNHAIFTFIAEGNKYNIRKDVENYPGKEYYIGFGTVRLRKKIIFTESPLLKGFDQVTLLNKGKGIVIRLSDLLRYYNPIKIKDAHIFFNKSEEIQKKFYNLNISDFVIGYEQRDKRGDEKIIESVIEHILKGDENYKRDWVELSRENGLIKINVRGTCPSNRLESYKKKDQVITLDHAITDVSSSNWVDNTDGIFKEIINKFSYRRPIFLNLRKFGEIEKIS